MNVVDPEEIDRQGIVSESKRDDTGQANRPPVKRFRIIICSRKSKGKITTDRRVLGSAPPYMGGSPIPIRNGASGRRSVFSASKVVWSSEGGVYGDTTFDPGRGDLDYGNLCALCPRGGMDVLADPPSFGDRPHRFSRLDDEDLSWESLHHLSPHKLSRQSKILEAGGAEIIGEGREIWQ